MGLITDLTAVADAILGVRDSVGAVIEPVYIVTRTWSGTQPGDGTKVDVVAQVQPSPAIKNLANDFRARAAGNYEMGDMQLVGISKQSYTTRASVDLTPPSANVEKFYRIAGKLYNVTQVEESYITWNVRIREAGHTG